MPNRGAESHDILVRDITFTKNPLEGSREGSIEICGLPGVSGDFLIELLG